MLGDNQAMAAVSENEENRNLYHRSDGIENNIGNTCELIFSDGELPQKTQESLSTVESTDSATQADIAGESEKFDYIANEGNSSILSKDISSDLTAQTLSKSSVVPVLPEGTYAIRPAMSETRYLGVAGGSLNDGANIQIFRFVLPEAQSFAISYDANGFASIRGVRSGGFLGIAQSEAKPEANVQQGFTAANAEGQKWEIREAGNGTYVIASAMNSGLVLDISGAWDGDDANVQTYFATGGANQRFVFESIPASVEPSGRTVADGVYSIRSSQNPLLSFDIGGCSKGQGVALSLYPWHDGLNQRFAVKLEEDGFYTVNPVHSGLALDVEGASIVPRAGVVQWAAREGAANQRWAIVDEGDGSYTLVSKLSGRVLDVEYADARSGARIQTYFATGGANQRFVFESIPASVEPSGRTVADGVYSIRSSQNPLLSFDIGGCSKGQGVALSLYPWHDGLNQRFAVKLEEDGFYTVNPVHSGLALDVEGASIVPRAGVVQWAAREGAANQRWAIVDEGDGSYTLVSKLSGRVLDVEYADARSGARIQTYFATGGANQRFVFVEASSSPLSEGVFNIEPSELPGKRLDVDGCSDADGARVLLWDATTGFNQKFEVEDVGESVYAFRSLCSGKYISVSNGRIIQSSLLAAGSRWKATVCLGGVSLENEHTGLFLSVSSGSVSLTEPSGLGSQVFSFYPTKTVDSGVYFVSSATGGRVLDVASRRDGQEVTLWSQNGGGNQKWAIESQEDGWFVVRNCRTKKVLDASGKTDSGPVVQWRSNGGSHQRWRAIPAGDGWFYLRSKAGLYLDVRWGDNYDGAPIQTWNFCGTPSQKFRFSSTTYVDIDQVAEKRPDGAWDWYRDGEPDRNDAITRVINTARSLLGVPYVWLGVYPQDGGMDCASFTWYVYRQLGIEIGFETYDQMYAGYRIASLSDAKPGDIILMYYGGWPNYNPLLPEHVVLYAGNGMIYEEPDFGGHCQFVPLASKGAGRIEIRRIIGD